MSRIQKLLKDTAVYGISSILGRALGVVLVPFYAHHLPVNDNGVIGVVFAAFIFLNILYTYGLESAYLKFASGKEGRINANLVFSTATLMLIISSMAFSLTMSAFPNITSNLITLNPQWQHLVFYMAAIVLLDTMSALPYAELRLSNRPYRFAAVRLSNILLNLVLNVFFIAYLKLGITGVFIANVLASGFQVLFLLPVYFERFRFIYDGRTAKSLLKYSLPLLPNGLAFAVTETLSRFFLNMMSKEQIISLYGKVIPAAEQAKLLTHEDYGDYVTGIFNNIYKLGVFMMLFTQMFRFAWQPFYFSHAEDPDAKPLFARVFLLFTAIGLTAWLSITFFAHEIVSFPLPGGKTLLPSEYWFALPIVPIVLGAYFLQGWENIFSAGIYIQKQTSRLIPITLLGALATFLLNFFLVPQYGILAAAWSTFGAYLVMSLGVYFSSQQIYPIQQHWGQVGLMVIAALGIFGLWQFLPALQIWYFELLLIVGFTFSLFAVGVLSKDIVRTLFKRK
ncbi:MAG: polysaccharide biosynthesis C-terminal domain-containing protein [Rhodothermia bacterium]|nr:polysaccharide biosynthesis C-terminal domain-containing protein [Rhodothermia bacterium]